MSLPSSETEQKYVHKDKNSIVYPDQHRLGSEGEKSRHLLNTNEVRLVCELLGSEATCHLLLVTETSLCSSLPPPQDKVKENTVTPGKLLYMKLQNVINAKTQSSPICSDVPRQT